jgi:hypothetical protein
MNFKLRAHSHLALLACAWAILTSCAGSTSDTPEAGPGRPNATCDEVPGFCTAWTEDDLDANGCINNDPNLTIDEQRCATRACYFQEGFYERTLDAQECVAEECSLPFNRACYESMFRAAESCYLHDCNSATTYQLCLEAEWLAKLCD